MTGEATDSSILDIQPSESLTTWLDEQKVSLAFTTYEVGRLFMIGLNEDGSLSVFERPFPRTMGIGINAKGTIWLSGMEHLYRFQNFVDPGRTENGRDALYMPLASNLIGYLDIHDVVVDDDDQPWFAATQFNSIASLDPTHSFAPRYRPPFIDRLVAEDRCHLNGIAMRDGRITHVTAASQTNVVEGWRDHRRDGGIVLDVHTDEVITQGLSMPHSPRWHDDQLWVINSGKGEFGRVDLATGQFEPVCFLPGFARGLSMLGDYAVIGLSSDRKKGSFQDLALGERLTSQGIEPFVGLAVVNLKTGTVDHRLTIKGYISEVSDCIQIPGIRSPAFLGLINRQTRFLVKPSPQVPLPN